MHWERKTDIKRKSWIEKTERKREVRERERGERREEGGEWRRREEGRERRLFFFRLHWVLKEN